MAGVLQKLMDWIRGTDDRSYHRPSKVNGKTVYRSANHYHRKYGNRK